MLKENLVLTYCLHTQYLVYEIWAKDVYEGFYEDKGLFDFSDYPQNSKLFDPGNKKVISKKKDRFEGRETISEFVWLK